MHDNTTSEKSKTAQPIIFSLVYIPRSVFNQILPPVLDIKSKLQGNTNLPLARQRTKPYTMDKPSADTKNPESVAIKVENLACEEYADKRQKIEDSDNLLSNAPYTSDDLYGDKGISPSKEKNTMPSIAEILDKVLEAENTEVSTDDEFIPFGARGKV